MSIVNLNVQTNFLLLKISGESSWLFSSLGSAIDTRASSRAILDMRKIRIKNASSLKGEIWKDVIGCEQLAEVSNLGRVRSKIRLSPHNNSRNGVCKTGGTLFSIQENGFGYQTLRLLINGKYRNMKVHRLVADAFLPNPENKRCVNHKNRIKTDNRMENLEWTTNSENTSHAYREIKKEVAKYKKCYDLTIAKGINPEAVPEMVDVMKRLERCLSPLIENPVHENLMNELKSALQKAEIK